MGQTESLGLDGAFDHLTALLCSRFDTPFALVSFVHGDRALYRSEVSVEESALPREVSASEILVGMGSGARLVVEDCRSHPILKNHPKVIGEPFLRYFAGVTVSNAKGEPVGAVGVMDCKTRPAPTAEEFKGLDRVASIAGSMLEQISAQRLQAERLALLTLAEEMSGVGHWRYDVLTREITWSDEVYRIHGVIRETFDPSAGGIVATYHPDDQPVFRGLLDRAISTGQGYEYKLGGVDKVPDPQSDRCNEDEAEEAVGGFVVSGGQSSAVFEL